MPTLYDLRSAVSYQFRRAMSTIISRSLSGMTVTLNIIMDGALTGAAFNPARALGPMIATGNFRGAWLYVVAPIVGALVAAIVHTGFERLAHGQPAGAHNAAE
jgi:glycerol uptake facilitator-like aquaporin